MRTRILLPSALILFSEVFGLGDTDSFAGNERWLFFTNEFSYWRWELLWMQALTEMTWDELFPSGIFTSSSSMLLLSNMITPCFLTCCWSVLPAFMNLVWVHYVVKRAWNFISSASSFKPPWGCNHYLVSPTHSVKGPCSDIYTQVRFVKTQADRGKLTLPKSSS